MAKVATPSAGRYAQLTAEAIGVYAKRAGLNTTQLRTRAGMTYGYYYARITGRSSFTLNDVDALCKALGVSPLEVAQMATMLGRLAPREDGDGERAAAVGRTGVRDTQ